MKDIAIMVLLILAGFALATLIAKWGYNRPLPPPTESEARDE